MLLIQNQSFVLCCVPSPSLCFIFPSFSQFLLPPNRSTLPLTLSSLFCLDSPLHSTLHPSSSPSHLHILSSSSLFPLLSSPSLVSSFLTSPSFLPPLCPSPFPSHSFFDLLPSYSPRPLIKPWETASIHAAKASH
eukprot:GILI01022392.1.p1 GENE.GILI01022392.1~~GILI01022392.1.p1  ORF type:complete len:135 (-),score=10.62 GILI01022392.1:39-443(-)